MALLVGVLRVGGAVGKEVAAAAAERDLKAVAIGPAHQLVGDVLAVAAGRAAAVGHRLVVFPVAVRHMGIGRRRRGMGDAGGRDDAGREPGLFGHLEDRLHFVALGGGAV